MVCERPALSSFQKAGHSEAHWVLWKAVDHSHTPEPSLSAGSAGQERERELQICDYSPGCTSVTEVVSLLVGTVGTKG